MRTLIIFLFLFNSFGVSNNCRNLDLEVARVKQIQEKMSLNGIHGELKNFINSEIDRGVGVNDKFLQRISPRELLEEKTFTNYSKFEEHFGKHGKEFGKINEMQYLKRAQNLAESRDSNILTLKTQRGAYKYDPKKNEILIVNDGHFKTFYRPNLDYINKKLAKKGLPPVSSVMEWLVKHQSDPF